MRKHYCVHERILLVKHGVAVEQMIASGAARLQAAGTVAQQRAAQPFRYATGDGAV